MKIGRFLPGHGSGDETAHAQAVVVSSESIPGSAGIWGCKFTLRVHFDDGATSEFETTKRTIDLGGKVVTPGDILPVKYDPEDRSKVELDVDAVEQQSASAEKAQDDAAVARAEAQLDGTAQPNAPTGSPESFAAAADSFAASSRGFPESSYLDRAAKEREANGGGMPTEALAQLDQDHTAGLIEDDVYQELMAKLTSGGTG